MLNPNEYDVQLARCRELERVAQEDARLVEVRKLQLNHAAPHAQALAKVGDMLVKAGSKLQERYGTLIEEATQTPAKAC